MLDPGSDYLDSTPPNIALETASLAGDVFDVYAFKSFKVADAVQKTGDTMHGTLDLVEAPQFDNSSAAASTSFVQRALGSFPGYQNITAASTALTVADAGQSLYFGSAATSATLPALAGTPAGTAFSIAAQGAFSISAATGDVIDNRTNGGASSISLQATEDVVLVSTGTGWFCAGGSYALRSSAAAQAAGSMFMSSLLQSGYQQLPSGLIIQWGSATVSGTSATATFPVAFPTACLQGFSNNTGAAGSASYGWAEIGGLSTTQMSITGTDSSGAVISTGSFGWLAIGH
jgi:hypothetical protein